MNKIKIQISLASFMGNLICLMQGPEKFHLAVTSQMTYDPTSGRIVRPLRIILSITPSLAVCF